MKTLRQIREEYDSKYVPQNNSSEEMVLEVKSNSLIKQDVPSVQKMPAMLLFRRVAYKQYPQNQVVALYYSKLVDKYLSVPFGKDGNLNLSEATVHDTLEEGAKWDATKGAISGGLHGAVRGGAIGGILAPGPGTAIGAVVGGVRGAYKGAKKGLEKSKEQTVKESFLSRVSALREEEIDEGVGDYIEQGRSYVEKKIKSSPTASKVFKKVQDFGHKLPGYENVKAAKEKFNKGDYGGAAWEAGKSALKALGTGAAVAGAAGIGSALSGASAGVDAVRKSTSSTGLLRDKPRAASKSSWKQKEGDPVTQSKLRSAELKQASGIKENKISDLRNMIKEDIDNMNININGRSVTLNTNMAKRILEVYDSVNTKNKKIVEGMLNEDLESFKKLLNFSIRK